MNIFLIEILFIVILILFNGVLAMAEMAFVSSKKARLAEMANKGDKRAKAVLKLLASSSEFLASIQVGITLIGVIAGTFGGATISEKIAVFISARYSGMAEWSEAIGVTVVVIFVTYFSLILGELVPKRLALNNPEKAALRLSPLVLIIRKLFHPLVWLLSISTDFVLRLRGRKPELSPVVTEEEVKMLIEQGRQVGIFEKLEEAILKKVLRLGDLTVKDIMTPRTQVVSLDLNLPKEKILAIIEKSPHMYFPVYKKQIDNIVGLLSGKRLLKQLASTLSRDINMEACIIKDPLFVPLSLPADKLLEKFKETRFHMAMVLDEFGGVAGIVSIMDLMESIVGNLPEADDAETAPAVQLNDGSWLLEGYLPVQEVKELTGLDVFDTFDTKDIFTVAGVLMQELDRIPVEGDVLTLENYTLEVVDMDGKRVDKIRVKYTGTPRNEAPEELL